MAFKPRKKTTLSIESPESLFADIKTKKIPGLLTQQGDLLRDYHQHHQDTADLAIQLPTGSGKTLVALLIGEWRRLAKEERVLFICPTKQLVHQVAEQAIQRYGLRVTPFTGSRKHYSTSAKQSYKSGESIAVTTYSSLFNTNPFFDDPHTIIFDDAHAADSYVASNWTLDIHQYEEDDKNLFNAIATVLRPLLRDIDFRRLTSPAESSSDRHWYDKIPASKLADIAEELDGVITANIGESRHTHPWQHLTGKLVSCNLFIGSQTIYLRPYLSPTFDHSPFASARQRIYLSATPGEGGELERIFCRRSIHRMDPPAGWDRHTIGRRFFLFPDLSLDSKESMQLLVNIVNARRVLLLTGDNKMADTFKTYLQEHTDAPVFGAADIEKSKQEFLANQLGVAILANRYDGIDFPEDECRNIVLQEIPTASNPQEKFLISRMGAARVHDVRILTKIIQAFGRCTRSGTDYSTVVIFGDNLASYLSKRDRRAFLHAELQAEIEFGREQSQDADFNSFVENLDHFFDQDDAWIEAQSQIYDIRNQVKQETLPGSRDLSQSASQEVKFVERLWSQDLRGALDSCRDILAILNDPSLRGERALWNYFAGSLSAITQPDSDSSDAYFREAAGAAPSLSWLHSLRNSLKETELKDGPAQADLDQIDMIEDFLEEKGVMTNRDYNRFEAEVRSAINDPKHFERGHRDIARFLGLKSGKIESDGSPDPWWQIGSSCILVFEDHANAKNSTALTVSKARQAATHKNWVKANLDISSDCKIYSYLVTPVSAAKEAALCHLEDVDVIDLKIFGDWCESIFQKLREIRASFSGKGDIAWRADALSALKASGLNATNLVSTLTSMTRSLDSQD